MAWTQVASQSGSVTQINGLAVLSAEMYGAANDGSLLKWNGSTAWTVVAAAPSAGLSCYDIVEFGGVIYGIIGTTGTNIGSMYYYTGSAWSATGMPAATDLIKFMLADSRLFIITSSGGAYSTVSQLVEYIGTATVTIRSSTTGVASATSAIYRPSDGYVFVTGSSTTTYISTINGTVGTAFNATTAAVGVPMRSSALHGGVVYTGGAAGGLYSISTVAKTLVATTSPVLPITSMLSAGGTLYLGLSAT